MIRGAAVLAKLLLGATISTCVAVSTVVAAEPLKITVGYQNWWAPGVTAAIIRGLGPEYWKKFLPPNVDVEFQAQPQGPVIINNMLANKQQIGYVGDMPGVVSTTKEQMADIRMVAVNGFSMGQMCHLLMVRKDAPAFKSPKEAIQWLNGKTVAAPKGGCTDLFFRTVMKDAKIVPKEYLQQGVEQIVTNFRAGRIDAAAVPDFPRARIEAEGTARLAATGYNFNLPDASVLVMRKDFMDQHREVAKGWLRMEMYTQQHFLLDPSKWDEVARMAVEQNPGYTKQQIMTSLFTRIPAELGGAPVRISFPFVFDDQVKAKMLDAFKFLYEIKVIDVDKPRDGAFDDTLAREVASEAKVRLPLGEIK